MTQIDIIEKIINNNTDNKVILIDNDKDYLLELYSVTNVDKVIDNMSIFKLNFKSKRIYDYNNSLDVDYTPFSLDVILNNANDYTKSTHFNVINDNKKIYFDLYSYVAENINIDLKQIDNLFFDKDVFIVLKQRGGEIQIKRHIKDNIDYGNYRNTFTLFYDHYWYLGFGPCGGGDPRMLYPSPSFEFVESDNGIYHDINGKGIVFLNEDDFNKYNDEE